MGRWARTRRRRYAAPADAAPADAAPTDAERFPIHLRGLVMSVNPAPAARRGQPVGFQRRQCRTVSRTSDMPPPMRIEPVPVAFTAAAGWPIPAIPASPQQLMPGQ